MSNPVRITALQSAAAQERPAPAGSVVRFKNGSIMPCRIVREDGRAVMVESYGVEFEIARDEIEYHGDAAGCLPVAITAAPRPMRIVVP